MGLANDKVRRLETLRDELRGEIRDLVTARDDARKRVAKLVKHVEVVEQQRDSLIVRIRELEDEKEVAEKHRAKNEELYRLRDSNAKLSERVDDLIKTIKKRDEQYRSDLSKITQLIQKVSATG